MTERTRMVEFGNGRGDTLAARLELPSGTPVACALFAHCFTCSKDFMAASRISRALRGAGLAVLRFDFTGLGNSEGDFANTNFSSNVDDLLAAAAFLEREVGTPGLLLGHSLGGAAVLVAAARLPAVRVVATIGAPSTPEHVLGMLADDVATIEQQGEACVTLGGRRFRIRKQFVDDIARQDLSAVLAGLGKMLVVFHAPEDEVVPVEEGHRLFAAAAHPKHFVSLAGADHLLTRREDAAFVARTIVGLLPRGLRAGTDEETPGEEPLPHGIVEVAERGDGRYTQRVRAGRHAGVADEPASVGGDDAGPGPYEYLLSALGACTSMTLRMYAERKGLDLEHVFVRLRHRRIHAEDCRSCETKTGKVDRIDIEVRLQGDLTEEQRARLLEISHRCPVHRTLVGEKEIVVALAPGA